MSCSTLFLVAFTFLYINHTYANAPKVQVLVAKSIPKVKISGANIIKSYKHRPYSKQYNGNQTLTLDCEKKLSSAAWKQGPLLASLSNKDGILEWKKNRYQGEFFVVRSENKKGCDLVQEVNIDQYISTLVAKEMHKGWPLEALKAQAVAARTYALFKRNERQFKDDSGQFFDLESSEKDQVSGSLDDVNQNTLQAAFLTKGEVLIADKQNLAPAFYHSKCGGQTHLPEQVWGNKVSGYKPVNCPFCKNKGQSSWKTQISISKIAINLLNIAWPNHPYKSSDIYLSQFEVLPSNSDSQEIFFKFKGRIYNVRKAQLRKSFGRERILSTNFNISSKAGVVTIAGEGLGHGVGLCQIGTLELAKRGYNYRQILSFYYPDFQLKNYY